MRAQTKFKSCRQIAAIQTVILTENQNSESSEGSGEDAAQGVTMIAKRDFEQVHLPIEGLKSSSRKDAVRLIQKDSLVYKARRKTWQQWSIFLEKIHRDHSKRQPEHDQRTDTASDTHHSNKERCEVCRKEGSKMTEQVLSEDSHQFFKEKNLCTSELCKVTLARIRTHRLFSQKKKKLKRIRIVAVSNWIFGTRKFHTICRICGRRCRNKQKAETQCTSHSSRHWIRPLQPEVQAQTPLVQPGWPIVCDWSWSGAEFTGIQSNRERKCRVLRHSSVRVPHKDHQPQRRTRKVRERRISRRRIVSNGKESARQRSAEGNLMAQRKTRNTWKLDSWEKSQAQLRLLKKTKAAKSMFNEFFVPKEADEEQFLQMWREAWRIDSITRKRALKSQLRKAAKSINHTYNFAFSNRSDEANARAHQKIRHVGHWCATLSDDAQGKGSPTQSPNIRCFSKVAWIAGKKTEDTGIKCSSTDIQKKSCKAGSLKWEKDLGDHAEYHQPLHSREQIHSGRLNIKHSEGNALPVKQQAHQVSSGPKDCLKESEQEPRMAGGNPMQEEQQARPSSSSSSQWDGWWRSSWWDKSVQCKESVHDGLYSEAGVPLMIRCGWISERDNPHLSSCTSSFLSEQYCSSQDCGICLSAAAQVSALCFAHRRSWILLGQCYRLACCDGSTRKKVIVCPHHTHTLRTSDTPRFCGHRRHTPFTGYVPKEELRWIEEIYWWEAAQPRRFFWEEMSQGVWWAIHFQHFRHLQMIFTTQWKSRIWRQCKWNLLAGRNVMLTHCMDQEDMKTLSVKWNLRC